MRTVKDIVGDVCMFMHALEQPVLMSSTDRTPKLRTLTPNI